MRDAQESSGFGVPLIRDPVEAAARRMRCTDFDAWDCGLVSTVLYGDCGHVSTAF
jgi:hypothetical protein